MNILTRMAFPNHPFSCLAILRESLAAGVSQTLFHSKCMADGLEAVFVQVRASSRFYPARLLHFMASCPDSAFPYLLRSTAGGNLVSSLWNHFQSSPACSLGLFDDRAMLFRTLLHAL